MTLSEYIPFINTASDCAIAKQFYPDAVAMRISLESISKTNPHLPNGPKRWVDPSIDGLHHKNLSKLTDNYLTHIKSFAGHEQIADAQFQQYPDKQIVEQFVFSVLDCCKLQTPDWISVPQLPLVNSTARNKINKLLAEKTKLWKAKSTYRGKLILPAILT